MGRGGLPLPTFGLGPIQISSSSGLWAWDKASSSAPGPWFNLPAPFFRALCVCGTLGSNLSLTSLRRGVLPFLQCFPCYRVETVPVLSGPAFLMPFASASLQPCRLRGCTTRTRYIWETPLRFVITDRCRVVQDWTVCYLNGRTLCLVLVRSIWSTTAGGLL